MYDYLIWTTTSSKRNIPANNVQAICIRKQQGLAMGHTRTQPTTKREIQRPWIRKQRATELRWLHEKRGRIFPAAAFCFLSCRPISLPFLLMIASCQPSTSRGGSTVRSQLVSTKLLLFLSLFSGVSSVG